MEENIINKKLHIGETNITTYGSNIEVIKYNNHKNIIVEFKESGYLKTTSYDQFKDGRVKSPYCRTVCHKGYLGEGKYTPKANNKEYCRQYITWHSMLQRCYSKKYQETRPTYEGCEVCLEFIKKVKNILHNV